MAQFSVKIMRLAGSVLSENQHEDNRTLKGAVEFLGTYQNQDGSFSYGKRKSKLPCVTANILSVLGRLGNPYSEVTDAAYSWLLAKQAVDGGWRCATAKQGQSPETDASNPGTTLWVLDACLFRDNNKQETEALNEGAAFLLDHWDSRAPLGPCTFGIGSRFLKTEFPFRRYNLFYYVYVLSHYDRSIGDIRLKQAFNALVSQSVNDGLLVTAPHKAWKGSVFSPETGPSRPASEYWWEICKRIKAAS